MENGFPAKYNLFPTIDRITDVAKRLGKFLSPQTSVIYLSEHIRHEASDGEAIEPQSFQPVLDGWDSLGNYIDPAEY